MTGLFRVPIRATGRLIVAAAVTMIMSAGIAQAQEEPPPPPPPAEVEAPAKPRGPKGPPPMESRLERMMERLTTDLELTDDQAIRVRGILENRMARQEELFEQRREEQQTSRQEMQAQMMKLRAEGDEEIKKLLNEEQSKKYDEFMKDRGPHRGQRGGMRGRRHGR